MNLCFKRNYESICRLESLLGETLNLAEKEQKRCQTQAATHRSEFHPKNPKLRQAKARAAARARRRPEALRTHPKAESILSRPRPYVSGRRRVPKFVVSQGVPFLRIKKPQPPSLSRALRSKAANRWKRIVRHERLSEELTAAEAEDKWDHLVGDADDSTTYATTIQQNLRDTSKWIRIADEKNAELARKMWAVVLKERELAVKEKQERKRVRRERWLEQQPKKDSNNQEESGGTHTTSDRTD